MDSSGINCTVSLMRCDDISQIPLFKTDVINSADTISMEPKDTGVSNKTIELKRSARLSKKRTLQDNLQVTELVDRLNDSNEGEKLLKSLKSKKNKTEMYVTPKNDIKKINNRDSVKSTINTTSELNSMTNVQSSLNTIVDNGEKISVKILPRAFKNKNSSKTPMVTCVKNSSTVNDNYTEDEVRSKHEKIDELVKLPRKRGRPSQKEPQFSLQDVGKVNTSNSDENDLTPTSESNRYDDGPPKPKRKQIGTKSSMANVEIVDNDSCTMDDSTEKVKAVPTIVASENDKISSRDCETFDREIALISNRFNVPCNMLRNIIEKESISVLREKYSDTVTMSMITVSPVVSLTENEKRKSGRNSNCASVKYKIEPVRETVAYEKTNLKDTMEEVSKTMPSWSLSIVADPPRYVISQMSIETYGTPIANKSVVLDRYFRASVYINQRLEYKYCKRYTTAADIVNLIKELDAIII
ncbi:M-phase inducer phosphatase-like [Aphis craccivora]|uniref:M-phase inducer phosphatase-like n=1 Tax=Aphis craccivora TaxID=307492 RepID=A0A6G0Z3H3_APHCR|nr:M-phase inducer phosphatase-like [Aphis craccivora]